MLRLLRSWLCLRSAAGSLFAFRRAASLQALDDRRANFRPAIAAIAEQEHCDVAEFAEIGAINDRSASPLEGDKTCAGEDCKMRRQGIRRDLQEPCKITGRNTVGLVPDQGSERFQAGRLCERREGQNCFFRFHISRVMEVNASSQRQCRSARSCISKLLEISIDSARNRRACLLHEDR